MSGDTSLLKAILTNNLRRLDYRIKAGIKEQSWICVRVTITKTRLSVRAQGQSLVGWKEVMPWGSKQWLTSGIQTPSFLTLMKRQASLQQ